MRENFDGIGAEHGVAMDTQQQRCENALGRTRMPEGYELWRDDDGCYWWRHPESERSSILHWDRWAVYRNAKIDFNCRNKNNNKKQPCKSAAVLKVQRNKHARHDGERQPPVELAQN